MHTFLFYHNAALLLRFAEQIFLKFSLHVVSVEWFFVPAGSQGKRTGSECPSVPLRGECVGLMQLLKYTICLSTACMRTALSTSSHLKLVLWYVKGI